MRVELGPEHPVDRTSLATITQPDGPLILIAIGLAFGAGFISLNIYGHAFERRPERRLSWLLLAGGAFAFGLWSAHLVAVMARASMVPGHVVWELTALSLSSLLVLACFGFAVASHDSRCRIALGGAANGTGVSLMHFFGLMAIGAADWDAALMLAALALGIGLNSAAFLAYRRLKGKSALWAAALLVTLGFIGLHLAAVGAVTNVSSLAAAPDGIEHERIFALVVAGAAIVVLAFSLAAKRIDAKTLSDNAARAQELVDAAIDGIAVVENDVIVNANRGLAELCGVEARELIGRPIEGELLKCEDERSFLRSRDGSLIPVKVRVQWLSHGETVYAVHDLTKRHAVEEELQSRNDALLEREEELSMRNMQFDTALRHMSQGLCMYDKDERLVVCNERYATLFGLAPDAVKPGMKRADIVALRIANGLWAGPSPEDYLRERTKPIHTTGYSIQEMSDGRYIASTHQPMPNGGWVCTHEDVTERELARAKIEHLARHDVLTDLPNRILLREMLQETLNGMRPGDGLAVHCIDLDRFQEVNDALGHAIGDELLQAFAGRLRRLADGPHIVARTGGDEFVIVQNRISSPTDATELAGQIIACMNEPFPLGDGSQVVVSVTTGIAMAPGDSMDADQLIKNANLALARAKEEERGHYCFFEMEMDAEMRSRHQIVSDLRNAIAKGELRLDFQPLLNLRRDEISGFEALLRWRRPTGEEISPADFIPLAEETGLIVPIGEWVLREALKETAKWPHHMRVAVNLSPVQFSSRNLVQLIMSALAAAGVEANRLELEITESLLMENRDSTFGTLHQLRDMGVRIALDDFGTGFSSLGYLRSFPFDKIKIDQSFVAGLTEGYKESLAIIRAVAQMGSSLGISTTAEGVETELQLAIVRKEGFTEAQGYLIGRPKNAADVAREYNLRKAPRLPRRTMRRGEKRIKPLEAEPAGGDDELPARPHRIRGIRPH